MDYLKNGFKQVVSITLPIIVGSVVQAGLQDVRIGKIFGGLSFIVSGVKSVWIWKNAKSPNEESTLKTVSRLGVGAMGVAGICFGVYQVATGVFELVAPETCEGSLLKAKEKLLSCPEAQRFWNALAKQGPFTARCATEGDGLRTISAILVETREILVTKGTTNEMVESLLFEASSLGHSEMSMGITRAYNQNLISHKKFFEAMKELANLHSKDVYLISEKCIQNGSW